MKKSKKHSCPNTHLLEAYLYQTLKLKTRAKAVDHHIRNCFRCQHKINALSKFSTLLEQEIEKPVSSTVFRLINQIENNQITIAGILLVPVQPLNGHKAMDFRSQLILSKPAEAQFSWDLLERFEVQQDNIFLRVIQSPKTMESTLYIFSHRKKLYRNVHFKINSGGKKFVSDRTGKIELGNFDIQKLDKKLITLFVED